MNLITIGDAARRGTQNTLETAERQFSKTTPNQMLPFFSHLKNEY